MELLSIFILKPKETSDEFVAKNIGSEKGASGVADLVRSICRNVFMAETKGVCELSKSSTNQADLQYRKICMQNWRL
jgi:hypothetical protein